MICGVTGGCSRAAGPVFYPVSGTLNRAGEPLADVRVHFEPVTGGRPSSGKADADGRFSLLYSADKDGVLSGDYKVWIEFVPETPQEEMQFRAGKLALSKEVQEALKKYGSAKVTPLKQSIQKAEPNLVLNLD
ncbi:MAG: hypothetical protein JWN70_3123 [Planctomycetaceae bacterium]|nr:hypothetical protein [Planctomycetaceae bacterium]